MTISLLQGNTKREIIDCMHYLSPFKKAFEDYLEKHPFDREPAELYRPAAYTMALGGKRLRPILVQLGYRLFKSDFTTALPVAMAVEVFHNFTLLHDDIMDEAPVRRGKPAVHMAFGTNAGILTGDVMLVWAYEWLLRAGRPELLPEMLRTFNQVAMEVCEGQQMDMNFEEYDETCLSDYLKMIELKTAALLAGSLKLGAQLGGATGEQLDALEAFGRNMGIAFQLQDDILDAFGAPEKVGKQPGGDIIQNKKTFLTLHALTVAPPATRKQLKSWMTPSAKLDPKNKVNAVLQIYNDLGLPQYAEEIKERYHRKALQKLEEVRGDEATSDLLKLIVDYVMRRDK